MERKTEMNEKSKHIKQNRLNNRETMNENDCVRRKCKKDARKNKYEEWMKKLSIQIKVSEQMKYKQRAKKTDYLYFR